MPSRLFSVSMEYGCLLNGIEYICVSNGKYANSLTTLMDGHKVPMTIRSYRSGRLIEVPYFMPKSKLLLDKSTRKRACDVNGKYRMT